MNRNQPNFDNDDEPVDLLPVDDISDIELLVRVACPELSFRRKDL